MSSEPQHRAVRLPPTSDALLDERTRPYFLWWTTATVGELKEHLAASDLEERAYWMGALLREANTRDVWLFVTPDEIRELWPRLIRYLGRSRQMWAWLLELPPPEWPPLSQIRAEHAVSPSCPGLCATLGPVTGSAGTETSDACNPQAADASRLQDGSEPR